MQSTKLGRTNESISAIGFGGMPLSIQGRPDEANARRTLEAALDAGIDFIDTADVYCIDDDDIGHNERLIANSVGDRARIATKAGLRRPRGAWTNNGSPKHIREACEHSLRMLNAPQIWLYQFHAPDPRVPFDKSIEAFAELQREGKCKHVGLSNVSIEEIDRASSIVEVQSVQNRLNPYFRESIDVAKECARRGITFLAYSPVGGGRLAKKLPKFPLLGELASKRGCSIHALVIAWVRAQGETVVPIPGARSAEHVLDSASAAEITLTSEELAAIDEAEFSRA